MSETEYSLYPIGVICSPLRNRKDAPKQGDEGAPDAWVEINSQVADGLHGIAAGDEIIIITWLHQGHRDVLKVHPRKDLTKPLLGVFATRSPDRPNPLGLHQVTVRRIEQNRMLVGPIEAIDGSPVVDIKPTLCRPLVRQVVVASDSEFKIHKIQWNHANGLRSRRWSRRAAKAGQRMACPRARGRSG